MSKNFWQVIRHFWGLTLSWWNYTSVWPVLSSESELIVLPLGKSSQSMIYFLMMKCCMIRCYSIGTMHTIHKFNYFHL